MQRTQAINVIRASARALALGHPASDLDPETAQNGDLERALLADAQPFGGWNPTGPSTCSGSPSPGVRSIYCVAGEGSPSPRAGFLLAPDGCQSHVRHERASPKRAQTASVQPWESRPLTPMPKGAPWYTRDAIAVRDMLASSYLNVLLLCIPLGFAAWALDWGAVPVFMLNFLSLVPLALLLGSVTEDLALRFGDVVGGLLNATFGNVVEVILSLEALNKGLYTVVAASLLGSILSNLLLVMGCCFLLGGLRYRVQTFNATANQATSSLLFLSCIGIIIPTASTTLAGDSAAAQDLNLRISRGAAVVLLFIYCCYLAFQLHTHHDLFAPDGDGDEEPTLTLAASVTALAVITACVAACSEFLTGAIEDFSLQTGLSQAFVGIIILPIAGNACEHIVAVMVAMKGKMDLALGVAIGSSIQIAIFAIPLAVIVGWVIGRPFSLDLDPFAVVALTVGVVHANFVTSGAQSHWLMGLQLIATYLLIAVTFLYR
ncbi:calcium proton exchanger [Raphidocelis subcapitata]|uniref:Vacuolar cation/proton exchanger n=1 Tax=Raphidocelis subcapitata TaxID=307507 RepID=A0A2V0P502_9CHLO|nr:calcium proton exchanger [Raphidocelis subcapitata]|eukprot:GBF93992.1 calcium proton exchanger [Raphidocelis subcapitata]